MKLFDSMSFRKPRVSKFDLSHERKLSCDMGKLIPIFLSEVLPGDVFKVKSELLLRFAPLLAPIMHRVDVYTHYFFIPNRLLWTEWEDFITGGRLGTSAPVSPYIVFDATSDINFLPGSLSDFLGFSVSAESAVTQVVNVSALPFRAYQIICNQYYRDQALTAEVPVSLASGAVAAGDLTTLMQLRTRAWEKDYFTSCRPNAQLGTPITVPVTGTVTPGTYPTGLYTGNVRKDSDNSLSSTGTLGMTSAGVERVLTLENVHHEILGTGTLTGGGMLVTEMRRAIRLQEWLEKNSVGGARYVEQIRAHFGVVSDDARLQRAEYLGGGKQPVVVSEVLTTTDIGGEPNGYMAGHGISVGNTNRFSRRFKEHGFVIGIMSVLPKTAYQQGLPRMFQRTSKFDYAWPELASIGEQQVNLKEVYFDPLAALGAGDVAFGYQSRFSEYKYVPSTVHGAFRGSLSYWHMGRIFASAPALNTSFVEADPTQRVFAVPSPLAERMYVQVYNEVSALRPLPYFSTPII